MSGVTRRVSSWGRLSSEEHHWISLDERAAVAQAIGGGGLAYGNGRAYGDECLNPGGTLWGTRGLDRFIAFDPRSGVLSCEAGVLLKDVIDIALPLGWFPHVVPGTQYVTVGGAIANDIHGKSHHVSGTFSNHVLDFEVVRTDGEVLYCSPTENASWFSATIGGMGLTGVITRATLQLRKVEGPWVDVETRTFSDLHAFFALADQAESMSTYTVAWIDCVGRRRGRGVFFQADHAARNDAAQAHASRPRTFSLTPPFSLVNRASLTLFNALYFASHSRRRGHATQHYLPYFFPLDHVLEWNRMYGPRGFYQYQCVVPSHARIDATQALLDAIAGSNTGSFLAVLKTFGSAPSAGMLSFPMEGTTLALDFPNLGETTLKLFKRLDAIVREAKGRLYAAKDACMTQAMFREGYPRWAEFETYRDQRISSALSRRLFGS